MQTISQLLEEAGQLLSQDELTGQQFQKLSSMLDTLFENGRDNPGVLYMLGTSHMRQGHWSLAEFWLREALKRADDFFPALNNLAFALNHLNRHDEAQELYIKAADVAPNEPAVLNNTATGYINSGTPAQALEYCDKALAVDPEFPDAHWNRGLANLELGNWREGWEGYHWGLKLTGASSQNRKIRHYGEKDATPYWDGTADKSVVVYSEQGVGDEILAASMLPDAIRDADIVFESHPRLVNIMRHTFGDQIPIYGTRKMPWADLEFPKWTKIDAKCPIFELGRLYRNSDADFPRTPYLKPFDHAVEQFQHRLGLHGERPRIGISWAGGSVLTRADLRSIPLEKWIPMLKHLDATWVSLQYDPAETPGMWAPIIDQFNRDTGCDLIHWEEDVNDLDLCYGGLIHALDLVVCVNTSLVHACGAFGVPCWTLTPSRPAWRYGVEGERIPWYGSWVRQIRQEGDDWAPALARVDADLQAKFYGQVAA